MCQFMSLFCKFHVLSNIVSMAVTVILSELEGWNQCKLHHLHTFLADPSSSEVLFNSESL